MHNLPEILKNLSLIRFVKGFLLVFPVLYFLNMFCWILFGDTIAGPELTFGRGFLGFLFSGIFIALFIAVWIFEIEVLNERND